MSLLVEVANGAFQYFTGSGLTGGAENLGHFAVDVGAAYGGYYYYQNRGE